MFYRIVVTLAYPILRIFWWFKITGRENFPQGAAVVAGNHTSNCDSLLGALALGPKAKINIMAKKELYSFKPFGFILTKLGAFPVDRDRADISAVKKALGCLKEGRKLLIFPEGTRVKEEAVQAKTGAALFAMRTSSPVVPLYISPGKKLFHKTRVIVGKPYFIEGDYKDNECLRKAADEIMAKIAALGE